jgi:hypothetical protein
MVYQIINRKILYVFVSYRPIEIMNILSEMYANFLLKIPEAWDSTLRLGQRKSLG